MFQKIGFDVKKLKRVAIGQLTLGSLQRGEYAFLDEGSLARIFRKRKSDEELQRVRKGPRPSRKKPKFQTKRSGRIAP
jgi:16S rRNA U516 pseudouridylate synthase RsuA-like enzyme